MLQKESTASVVAVGYADASLDGLKKGVSDMNAYKVMRKQVSVEAMKELKKLNAGKPRLSKEEIVSWVREGRE